MDILKCCEIILAFAHEFEILVKPLIKGWMFIYVRMFIHINLESSWLVEENHNSRKVTIYAWIEIGAFVILTLILLITFIIMKLGYLEVHLRYGLMEILIGLTHGEITEIPWLNEFGYNLII